MNEVTENSCDITLASIARANVNPTLLRKDIKTSSSYKFVFGHHAKFIYSKDFSTVSVTSDDILIPPDFFDNLYMNDLNPVVLSAATCHVHQSFCPTEFALNKYSDTLNCIEMMDSLPTISKNEAGLHTVDGNSTGCRNLHSTMAVLSPEKHCAHLSFAPMKDPSGKVKCSMSSHYALEDFFTHGDFLFFEQTAEASGLNSTILYSTESSSTWDARATGTCRFDGLEAATIQGAQFLPDNYFCYSYLETQQATGELNSLYWILLSIYYVIIRLLSFLILKWRAH